MTAEEAARLKPGDVVEVLVFNSGWMRATVEDNPTWVEHRGVVSPLVDVRVDGRAPAGRRRRRRFREPTQVRLPLDAAASNIFADWLEEHGEPDAAAKLRAAFPFVDGHGNPTLPKEV